MFKDAERYFEERFASSSSTTVAGRGEDDGEDDGSRDDGDVKNRKSFDTPTTAQTLLFSSEHVEQLEAFGFVVLDDVVPEQAVRQMYEQCESLADKLFPVNQEGRDDDLASIKIDIENPTASPLNVAGTFLWSLPRKLCEVSSSSSISPPKCALAARERAENTAPTTPASPRADTYSESPDYLRYDRSAMPVTAMAADYVPGHVTKPHQHPNAQLVHAVHGVMVAAIQDVAAAEIVQLDRLFENRAGEGRYAALSKTFAQATQLEVAFWQMGLNAA